MKTLKSVVWLSLLISILALFATSFGIFTLDNGGTSSFTTIHGETIEIYGKGLYRNDSLLIGAGNRGVDVVTLALGIPLLLISIYLYIRKSLRGGILLLGVLAYFLYVYATLAFGTSYNNFFLIYVSIFSACFYTIILLFTSIDIKELAQSICDSLPRKGIAVLMFAVALLTFAVWIESPITSLITGKNPEVLGNSTTLVTHAFDLAIIVPALFLSAILIVRRAAIGYLIAFPLLFITAMLAPSVISMTMFQLSAGVLLTTEEIAGFVAGFAVLGFFAIWAIVVFLRKLPKSFSDVTNI